MQEAATFILIAAVAIDGHIPTERVFGVLFLSALESAKVFLPVSYYSFHVG